jgi:hypothetical protein
VRAPPQVTVYARTRLATDVFMGEVVIPLREVEDFAAEQPDARCFTLGRRSAKENVRRRRRAPCRLV